MIAGMIGHTTHETIDSTRAAMALLEVCGEGPYTGGAASPVAEGHCGVGLEGAGSLAGWLTGWLELLSIGSPDSGIWVMTPLSHASQGAGDGHQRSTRHNDHHNVPMEVPITPWPHALLFDMDGTLIESHANVERAWATWATMHGLQVDEVLAMAHGLPADVTVGHWFPDAGAEEVAEMAAEQLQLQYDDVEGIETIDGVPELLEFLVDEAWPWAIYTSADAELARVRLEAAGLTPPVLVTRDQVDKGKPAPDGYLRAANILNISPPGCIVIEDTEVGLAAGRAAGMSTVGVRGALGDLPVRSISELHLWLTLTRAPAHDASGDASPTPFPFPA